MLQQMHCYALQFGILMTPITDEKKLEAELNRQLEILEFGTVEITPKDEFVAMLKKSLIKGTPLRVKCGIDPTRTDVHLGHLVPYRKMRAFQDLGHTGVVIIGDYTAQIGDPTGKNESRQSLSSEEVSKNAEFYKKQLLTVLDESKTEFRYQSQWFEGVGLKDIIAWAMQTTVAKLISHDTFKNRLESGASLGLHEMFYPVLQGVDSVHIKADVELGGSDQRFNVLMGRDYQKNQGQRPQVAMLLPIVTGLDGNLKMSKSLDNYIGVQDEPFDMFGKVMSIPDKLMLEYYQYIANTSKDKFLLIKNELESNSLHPNEAKKQLASAIVSLFHGADSGPQMRAQFERVFAKKKVPDDIDDYQIKEGDQLLTIIVESGLVPTNSEARRLFKQGAVSFVDGDKLSDPSFRVDSSHKEKVLKVGKRKFLRLK